MKGSVKMIPALRVTVAGRDGNSTKICHRATVAAKHWALIRSMDWWMEKGHTGPRPQAYDELHVRMEKMERRVLPLFKKVLP